MGARDARPLKRSALHCPTADESVIVDEMQDRNRSLAPRNQSDSVWRRLARPVSTPTPSEAFHRSSVRCQKWCRSLPPVIGRGVQRWLPEGSFRSILPLAPPRRPEGHDGGKASRRSPYAMPQRTRHATRVALEWSSSPTGVRTCSAPKRTSQHSTPEGAAPCLAGFRRRPPSRAMWRRFVVAPWLIPRHPEPKLGMVMNPPGPPIAGHTRKPAVHLQFSEFLVAGFHPRIAPPLPFLTTMTI